MSGKYQFILSTHLPNGDHMESRVWLRPEPYDRKMEEFDIEWFKKEIQKRIEYHCREIMKQEAPVAQPGSCIGLKIRGLSVRIRPGVQERENR